MLHEPYVSTTGPPSSAEVGALKAENADLRAIQRRAEDPTRIEEDRFPIGLGAPAAARAAVKRHLDERVDRLVLDRALLVVSELVTNSVVHSGAAPGASVILRVETMAGAIRLEVEDPGCAGTIAPRPIDLDGRGGMGLNLVQGVAERWGVERIATGGTRVWARLTLGSDPLPFA